ncbi:MAG: hypothetical protein HY925_12585 [Elusimicrobia bacterium]|nr:hypothetical protein [Elusimicrobiota bacterium]
MLFILLALALSRAESFEGEVPPIGREVEVSAPAPQGGSIWYEPPVAGLETPEAKAYAAEAARLWAASPDFPKLFSALCRKAAFEGRPVRGYHARTLDLLRGLIRWTREGAAPTLQNRSDWVLHFLYGAYYSATLGRTTAEAAALAKEERDAITPGNAFDLDDWAITRLGARWGAEASAGESLRLDLAKLPSLTFGKLNPGRMPGVLDGIRVKRWVDSAY